MIRLAAGTIRVGSDQHYPEERPAHDVHVPAFSISTTPITVVQFATFVQATGHVTVAETSPPGASRPPGSAVFRLTTGPVDLGDPLQWWTWKEGADWRRPDGVRPAEPDHPVVQVALRDALAYCAWARVRLPTEVEWEAAAQGSEPRNVWLGAFPYDCRGLGTTCAVSPGDFLGNVWEWTSTPWTHDHQPRCCAPSGSGAAHVAKGGSFLCAPEYCARYRPAARMAMEIDGPTCHLGFRVVSA